jgi:hypothetical protein
MRSVVTRLIILVTALLIVVHGECFAACSVLPCAVKPSHSSESKLPPCHQKRLPAKSHDAKQNCASPFIANAVEHSGAKPSFIAAPAMLAACVLAPEFRFAEVRADNMSPPTAAVPRLVSILRI